MSFDSNRSRPRRRPVMAGCLAFALTLGLAACGKSQEAGGGHGGPPGAGGAPPPMPVTVKEVQSRKVPAVVEAVGTLEGVREVEVRARVAGVLQKQLYKEGERVKAGQPLFTIERVTYDIALDAARAQVAQQQALVEQARRESQRLATLIKERAISQREAQDAASTLKSAEAQLKASRAQVREAQLNVGYAKVTAPIAGLAQRAQHSEGALVAPTSDAGLLTTIVQENPIRIRFALSQSDAEMLRGGKANEVHLLGADGKPTQTVGRMDYAASTIDPKLGTVQMRAEMPNADGRWLPGQFVRVQITAGEQDGFLVPQSAVASSEQGRFVWLIGPEGKAQTKPVRTGAWVGGDWVVRGLDNGDKVITNNLIKLRPGAAVQVAQAPPPEQGASGASGASGATGAMGAQGAVGATGAAGAQGAVGAQGASGAQGAKGAVGAQGAEPAASRSQ